MALREFSSVKVGDELPEKVIPLTRQDLVNYAGVSGTSTRSTGTTRSPSRSGWTPPSRTACSPWAWVADTSRPGSAIPAAVTEYNVRFTAVVPVPNDGMGAEIVFNGRVKSVEPESKSVTIAISATTGGKKIFGRAVATAKLA